MMHAIPRAAMIGFMLLACGCSPTRHQVRSEPVQTQAPQTQDTHAPPFDPLDGAYPAIHWMFNVYDVPLTAEIAPDGRLQIARGERARGLGLVSAAQVPAVFDSISAFPGAVHVAAPSILSQPGQSARIESTFTDKPGATIGSRMLAISGQLAQHGVETELDITNAASGTGCGTGPLIVAEGGAVLLLCPGPDQHHPMTLVVVRPIVLRSIEDYPFQRASSMPPPK